MILINLLPHREAARKQKREFFFATLGAAALLGGLLCGGANFWYQSQISVQKDQNALLKREITKLEGQIKDITGLQQEIAALRVRQGAVEELQGNRNLPVYLLTELVTQLPDGVYITSLKQDNQVVLMTGVAQSNERVSELLRNLANNSPWLTRPELVEITASTVALTARDQRRVSNFSMRVSLKRASDQVGATDVVAATVPAAAIVGGPANKPASGATETAPPAASAAKT